MRCGEHFELEAALDGGGPSQAPRRAASQPPRDPPRRPGTPHSPPPPPPTPRSTFPVAGGGWCASYCCERACASVPAIILSTAGLGMPGRACRAYPIDLRERLATRCIPFPCMPARRPHLLYTRMALLSMTRAATRAREACVSPGDVEVYRVNRNNHYTLEDTGEIRDILETDKRGRS